MKWVLGVLFVSFDAYENLSHEQNHLFNCPRKISPWKIIKNCKSV